jgi:Rrf2 family nitric oxide-sensitive transcriptional repressor
MLIHAALRAPELTTVGEIAQDFGLSATHLSKVAQTLAAEGYLQTVRGRAGGLRLARDPGAIRLGEVARVTEPDFYMAPCMAPDGDGCPISGPCRLRGMFSKASEAFLAELNRSTLADLMEQRKPMLVRIEAARAARQ